MADTLREALESARDGFINLRPAWDENPGMRRQIDAHIIRIDNVLSSPQAPDCSDEAQDAARYQWLAENAIIETPRWRHDGKDLASTKHVLDCAIDADMTEEGKQSP